MKSNFLSDLEKEKRLSILLDSCYAKYLKNYDFKRVSNIQDQLDGIDVLFRHKKHLKNYHVDEKAQLDYVNQTLPTFAFELFYRKQGDLKTGWLFDTKKKTDFYALVTSIFSDESNPYAECKITFVNRQKLLSYLKGISLSLQKIKKLVFPHLGFHGRMELSALDPKFEGYIYFSKKNKEEQPVNLVLFLDYLHQIGVAKRLI